MLVSIFSSAICTRETRSDMLCLALNPCYRRMDALAVRERAKWCFTLCPAFLLSILGVIRGKHPLIQLVCGQILSLETKHCHPSQLTEAAMPLQQSSGSGPRWLGSNPQLRWQLLLLSITQTATSHPGTQAKAQEQQNKRGKKERKTDIKALPPASSNPIRRL